MRKCYETAPIDLPELQRFRGNGGCRGHDLCILPLLRRQFCLDDERQKYDVNLQGYIHQRYTDDAEVIRAQMEATRDTKSFRHFLIIVAIVLMIPVTVLSAIFLNKAIQKAQGKVCAGSYTELVGRDYKTVEAHFEAAGFTDIELIDLDDAGIGFWNNDKVAVISIGGDTDFSGMDWFEPDTKVVISYH